MALCRGKYITVGLDGYIDPAKLEAAICNTLDRLMPAFHQHILEKKAAGEDCAEFSKKVVKLSFLTGVNVPSDITDQETLEKVVDEFRKGDQQI